MKSFRKKSFKQPPLLVAFILLMAVFLSFSGYMVSKYISKNDQESLYIAKAFYFTSDYLQAPQSNGEYVLYTLQEGEDSIQFQLRNYIDDLRSSEVDIAYEIYLNGKKLGNIDNNLSIDESFKDIVIDDLESGEHTVVAKAVSPYELEIGARFKIVDTNPMIEYDAYGSAESPVMLLTVRTNDYTGDIVISWDKEKVFPDKTDSKLAAAVASKGSHVVSLESNSEYTFRFFKSDLENDYTNTLNASTLNNVIINE